LEKTIYLFYGEDNFVIKTKTDQIIKKYDVDEFNITHYDMEEQAVEEAINDASTIPFMSDLKIVVIKNAYFLSNEKPKKEIKHDIEALRRYIENPFETTILIINAAYKKLDERKAITKLVMSRSNATKCDPLSSDDLRGWIKRQVGKQNKRIDLDAVEEFVKRVEHNTTVAVNELRKLMFYVEDIDHITLATIKEVITKNIEDNVYEISNAIFQNDRSKALSVYNDLVSYGEDPIQVLGMLTSKYREIMQVKQLKKAGYDKAEIANYYNVSSGRAYYMLKNANQVKETVVIKHLKKLETLDFQIKSGRIDKKTGLELFLLST